MAGRMLCWRGSMTGEIREIAERIKELREIAGVTAESLAEQLGISAETYRQYESGGCDIPVSVLYEIAGTFKVELTEILTGERPRLHTYSAGAQGRGSRGPPQPPLRLSEPGPQLRPQAHGADAGDGGTSRSEPRDQFPPRPGVRLRPQRERSPSPSMTTS